MTLDNYRNNNLWQKLITKPKFKKPSNICQHLDGTGQWPTSLSFNGGPWGCGRVVSCLQTKMVSSRQGQSIPWPWVKSRLSTEIVWVPSMWVSRSWHTHAGISRKKLKTYQHLLTSPIISKHAGPANVGQAALVWVRPLAVESSSSFQMLRIAWDCHWTSISFERDWTFSLSG